MYVKFEEMWGEKNGWKQELLKRGKFGKGWEGQRC
jgi:hypothetical protein